MIAPVGAQQLPSFAELEAAGARFGEIRVLTADMFDLDDPRENNWLYRLVNKLHINTLPKVVERALLFRTGDPVSVRLVEETERLLRGNSYLYAVSIRPIAVHDGVVDVEVKTRDTWSLEPAVSVSRAGGENTGRVSIEEENLFGTGISAGVAYRKDVDRSGTTFHMADRNIFGTRGAINFSYADQDDGNAYSFSLGRPFYALDARWATGFSASSSEARDAIFNSGNSVAEYRHNRRVSEVFGGWSAGLVGRFVQRYSLGLSYEDDDYELLPDKTPPERLPNDLTLAGPFARLQVLENAYRKDSNLNQIGRIEDLLVGFQGTLQLGRALAALGSSRDAWLYSANLGQGLDVAANGLLLLGASANGRFAGAGENQQVGATARYFHRQGRYILYYVAGSVDTVHNPDVPGPLLIGGDNGLRGYPLRYQAGEHRALLTTEARAYSNWYPFRLIRLGGAVFYDVGRAWHGENQNPTNPGWLSDVGLGLRFLSDRSAFGHVLHADFAFPLDRDPSIKKVQFLLRTKVAL